MLLTALSDPAAEFSVDLPGHSVAVAVRRNARARRMRLRYDPARAQLQLVLPPRASLRAARQWTSEQGAWIAAQLAKALPSVAVGAGTVLPWRGGEMLIDWAAHHRRAPTLAEDSETARLQLGGPQSGVGRRVGRWMQAQALEDLTRRTAAMAERAGVVCDHVGIGDPRGRWGSCSGARRIRYSWRVIMAPDHVRAGLVAHEVAHLVHMHHGPAFHQLVDDLIGDVAAQSRAWLKAHGPSLHRWRFDAP